MNRNDQILLSVFGAMLMMAFTAVLIAYYGTSETAANWTQSLLTAAAVIAAIVVPLRAEAQRRELRHHVAEVAVASKLRSWLRQAPQKIGESEQYVETNGQDGDLSLEIPSFSIRYEELGEMRTHHARQVLSLLERRERRQSYIDAVASNEQELDALMEFYEQIGQLFWSTRRIYREIARDRGLEEFTNRPGEIRAVKEASQKAKQHQAPGSGIGLDFDDDLGHQTRP